MKNPVASRAEQHNTVTGFANPSVHPDEELLLKKLVAAAERERAIKEYLKGLLAFPVAVAGVFLMWWSSKSGGFNYWFGTISGLVIMAVGMAYTVEFIKLLISGYLTKGVVAGIKGGAMKEWMWVFLALASTLVGVTLSIAGFLNGNYRGQFDPNVIDVISILAGIVLMAGGITYFWTRSKFYKG